MFSHQKFFNECEVDSGQPEHTSEGRSRSMASATAKLKNCTRKIIHTKGAYKQEFHRKLGLASNNKIHRRYAHHFYSVILILLCLSTMFLIANTVYFGEEYMCYIRHGQYLQLLQANQYKPTIFLVIFIVSLLTLVRVCYNLCKSTRRPDQSDDFNLRETIHQRMRSFKNADEYIDIDV